LQEKAQKIVELRNAVDAAEQKSETVRSEIGGEQFKRFCLLDANDLQQKAEYLLKAAEQASRERQPILTRLFWFGVRTPVWQRFVMSEKMFGRLLNL